MRNSDFRWRRAALAVAISLAAMTGLTGCNQANSEVTTSIITPVKLVTVPAVSGQATDNFLARIDATERAQLAFQVGGELISETKRMGESVQKGEVIARLDPVDYQLAVDAMQARFDLASTQYARDKQLFTKNLISADAFDQSKTRYQAAKAELEKARTDLSHTRITAPFDGIVSQTFSKQYQLVGGNQVVLNLINNTNMDVAFSMPVDYVRKTGVEALKGKQFWVRMDNHRSAVIPARFKEISTQPDADTNSYQASVTILRPESVNLLAGMTGQVLVEGENSTRPFSLPESAWVTRDESLGQVWRYDAQTGQVDLVEVDLNEQGDVIGGVSQGDMIVSAGVHNLVEGQVVKAWQREGGI